MESQDFFALQDAYKVMYAEAKDESPEKEEEDRKKDDDLAGSPNKKKNGKKADKDYDGDGKVESSKDEYFGSKDKAIKKAMGKDVKESRWWDVDINEAMVVTNADKKANTPAYQNYKKGLKKKDGTPMYKAADHMKEGYGKKKKKHDCASKVKHEEYGVGNCISEMHDLDENGNVAHYDVMFDHGVEKHVPVESLQILEGHMHEHFINEKESYDTVAAVIDYDRSKKGTDDATYDSMHGKKKQAKKERDYAAFEREKMKKDDPNWKHKKGSTSESVEIESLVNSGVFSEEEIAKIVEADRLGKLDEARRADKMGIARKKVTYDKGEETRNPNPDRGPTSLHKPAGSSLAGSKAASRARSLGDARRKANRKGANLAYGDREGRLSSFAATKRQSDADLGAQKAATDTGAHKDKKTGFRQDAKYGKRGDMRRPSYNPKHTANK